MIDISLVNTTPNLNEFKTLPYSYPVLFLGLHIKNEYDNCRITLNQEYNPIKFLHFLKVENNSVTCQPLYGIILKPNENIKKLMNAITEQENIGNMNLVIYENLISQYNLSCKETYRHFQRGVHPIDFANLKTICDDSFNTDKKIFQHLMNIKEDVFDFQKFASLKLFILSV
jgi:hypothetical protein